LSLCCAPLEYPEGICERSYDHFLFDCDGVIWHGDELIEGVADVLKLLRGRGKTLIFVTNNATKTRESLKAKFDKLKIQADISEIFGSVFASAAYLKYNLKFPEDKYVYVIGEEGIEKELDAVGIKHKGGTDPNDNVFLPTMDFKEICADPSIGAVMCGFDMKINYKKIAKAHRYLQENKDCLFILTNDDSTFPTADAKYPGSGSISAPLRFIFPKRQPIVVGKPNDPMLASILETHKLDKKRTIMIGDRLDTDIAFGVNGGISTLMVLTGVDSKADYEEEGAPVVPHFVVNSLGDFAALVQ